MANSSDWDPELTKEKEHKPVSISFDKPWSKNLDRGKRKRRRVLHLDKNPSSKEIVPAKILESLKGVRQFTSQEIEVDYNAFTFGRGEVCKGFILGQTPVSVHFFSGSYFHNVERDIPSICQLHHPNVGCVLGYCIRNKDFMLIFEYGNDTLDRILFGDNEKRRLKLDWNRRYNICLGIAKGLAYLCIIASSMDLTIMNLDTASIFLDGSFNPKIPLARMELCWRYGRTNWKDIIYSYGVVILEVLSCSRFQIDQIHKFQDFMERETREQKGLGNLGRYVDKELGSAYSEEQALLLLKLSYFCTKSRYSEHPPSILTVLNVLEGKVGYEELEFKLTNPFPEEFKLLRQKLFMNGRLKSTIHEHAYDQISLATSNFGDILDTSGLRMIIAIPEFTNGEISLATSDFAVIIQGSANVYLGGLPSGVVPDCYKLVVKSLSVSSDFSLSEYEKEVFAFSGRGHPNVTRILGFCVKSEIEVMLIYEFKQNLKDTTLLHFLRDQRETLLKLDMTKIWKICSGVASGLSYLHNKHYIHGDIKPANIVIDEDFNPKITNLSPDKSTREDMTYVTTKGVGAFGYLDPKYLRSGKFTEEGDVYSYGVIILELVSGKRFFEVNVCQLHECLNKHGDLLQFVDPRLIDSNDSKEKALRLLKLSVMCTQELERNKMIRPSLNEVVMIFRGDVQRLETSIEKLMQKMSSTPGICSHEAFEKLKALVLGNDLEKALIEETKSEIFHICEILHHSTFLPEARSVLAHRVKDFLDFTSQLSIACEDNSSYEISDPQVPRMDEKMKLLLLGLDQDPSVASSCSYDMIQLAESLVESRKSVAKRSLVHAKKCIDKRKEDWKFIQSKFK